MRGYLVKRDGRYYAVVYEGVDPLTHKERRTWRPAGTSRRDAERVLGELVQLRNTRGPVFTRGVTLGEFLVVVWLPTKEGDSAGDDIRTLRARSGPPAPPHDRRHPAPTAASRHPRRALCGNARPRALRR